MAEDSDNRDCEIGYRKPPVHGRFTPGQSGNPRGRPKGARGLGAELRAELDERVTVTVDGRQRRIPKRRLIIKALAAKAAKGDVRAADRLLSLVIQAEGFEDRRPTARPLSDSDVLMLDQLLGAGSDGITDPETGEATDKDAEGDGAA